MTSAASYPEPHHRSVAGTDGDVLEPTPEWAGDNTAATKFASPEAIRAALLPAQKAEFDAAYDAALTAARQTLQLDALRQVLRTWRRMALLTELDPDTQRRMLDDAAEIQRTGQPRPDSVSWTELKKDLGL